MAFNKRTWKGRQGVGLNKFSINGATPVPVVNQPDSITEVGDVLSAGNLNDLENRIDNAFTEEATAREEADTDLKNTITALQKQIDNITEAEDLLNTVDYANGENAIPPNVSKYAEVNVLRGVTRASNQLVMNGNFESTSYWQAINGSGSVSSNVYKFTVTNALPYFQSRVRQQNKTIIQGHKYLIIAQLRSSSAKQCGVSISGCDPLITAISANTWTDFSDIKNCGTGYSGNGEYNFGYEATPSINDTLECRNFMVRDLTLYFGGNIPSNAQTIGDIQKNYPELLIPSEYGQSLVSTTYSAVKSVGSNRMSLSGLEAVTSANVTFTPTFNSEGELEYITATGTSNASGNFDLLRNDDFHLPMGTYFVGVGANNLFYDILVYVNGTWATINKNGGTITVTDPSKAIWIRGRFSSGIASGFAKLYPKINIGSTELPFSPYTESSLSLTSPIALRSAGTVAEEAYLNEDGEAWKTNPIGSVDLGTLTWTYEGGLFRSTSLSSLMKLPSSGAVKGNMLCKRYVTITSQEISSSSVMSIAINANGLIYVADSNYTSLSAFVAGVSGEMLLYELATPNAPTQLAPIPDNFVKVEPNGTIETVQSQSPKVDGAMTVTYTNKVTA